MRYVFLIFIFSHFAAFGQFKGEWKPLPKVESSKAIINKRAAIIDTVVAKTPPLKIQEIPNTAKLEFISVVIPDTLEKMSYIAHPLNWTKKEQIPSGLIFKDIASRNIKYLDKAHGLPSKLIRSIAEDKNGLIYLASGSGLLIFNGTEVTIYEDRPHFSFSNLKSLYYDKNGKMWMATDEQVGYIYEDQLYLPENPIFGGVHQQPFREDENGDFIISTNYNGLFIVRGNIILHYEKDLPHNMIADAIRTRDDKLWIAFARHGVGFIKNDSLFAYKEFGDYNNSRAFLEDNGELWIGNFAAPILKFRNDSLFTIRLNKTTNYVYTLEKNAKGVWFACYGRGVYLVKPDGEYSRFNPNNGLNGRYAFDLFIDSYENVWIGNPFTGVSRIDENFFYQRHDIPFSEKISETEMDQEGNYWHFRSGGLLTKETSDSFTTYTNIPDSEFLLHGHCIDGFIRDDGVWMASYDMGIINMNNMRYTYYQIEEGINYNNTMLTLEPDENGGIWTVTTNNKLLYLYDERFYNFSNSVEWQDYVFTGMKKTSGGEIFATTRRNGIIHLQKDRFKKIELLESANAKQVYHVFKDSSDKFWFFLNNEIQLMNTEGDFSRVENPIFINNPIIDFVEIEKNNFLGVSSHGIVSIKKNPEGLETKIYDRNQGLYMVDNTSIYQKSNGEVIITRDNNEGLVLSDSLFINKKSPPKLSFNRVEIDNDTLQVVAGEEFEVEQGNKIRLVFNKIYWGNRSTLHYKLSNSNDKENWNEQESNALSFQELAHGSYQLSVYAMGDNQKSATINIDFKVLPYWYQTTWSKVLFVSIILGIVIAYFLYRERQARIIKRQLEAQVREKTSEIASQLEQKEILMQEVHHRVKNNLTFLKSLLFLRARASEDDDVKMILDECQARIQSIALVHQNLYDTEDVSMVDFSSFLQELFYEIESMFHHDKGSIDIDIDVNDMKLDMKLSIFLGLILNEMITNSYKYAFTSDGPGKISIQLKNTNGQFHLHYGDSGQGLPQNFDLQNSTGFGFKLIKILLSQINAQLSYEKNEMSTFKILIPNGK